jgi:hypothetical protein
MRGRGKAISFHTHKKEGNALVHKKEEEGSALVMNRNQSVALYHNMSC